MRTKSKKKAWIVFHTYEIGHQIEVFVGKLAHEKASRVAAEIALDYMNKFALGPEEGEDYADAKLAFDNAEYGTVLELIDVPHLDDRCNLEVFETEVK